MVCLCRELFFSGRELAYQTVSLAVKHEGWKVWEGKQSGLNLNKGIKLILLDFYFPLGILI